MRRNTKDENSLVIDTSVLEGGFELSSEELKKCRFKITNQTLRLAECIVHKGKHGVRLHPPHLFKLDKEGRLYKKKGKKWVRLYLKPRKLDKDISLG